MAWSQLPANLELFKDHYVKMDGKMVPQCYFCLRRRVGKVRPSR